MKFCKICLEETEEINENNHCKKCIKFLEEDAKEKLLLKTNLTRWDKSEQIYFLDGKGWITSSKGEVYFLGEEKDVEEILNSQIIPEGTNPIFIEEYIRIFKLLEEKDEKRTSATARRISNVRASKSNQRSNKRVRSMSNSRGRDKYIDKVKTSKKTPASRTRLKK